MASMLVMSSSSPKFDDMFFPRLSIIWVQIRNFDLSRETGDASQSDRSRDYSSFLTDLAGASVRLVSSIDRAGLMRAGQVMEAGLCNEVEIAVWSPDRPDRCGRSASSGRPKQAGSNSAPTAFDRRPERSASSEFRADAASW